MDFEMGDRVKYSQMTGTVLTISDDWRFNVCVRFDDSNFVAWVSDGDLTLINNDESPISQENKTKENQPQKGIDLCGHKFRPSTTVVGKTKWCSKCDERQ